MFGQLEINGKTRALAGALVGYTRLISPKVQIYTQTVRSFPKTVYIVATWRCLDFEALEATRQMLLGHIVIAHALLVRGMPAPPGRLERVFLKISDFRA